MPSAQEQGGIVGHKIRLISICAGQPSRDFVCGWSGWDLDPNPAGFRGAKEREGTRVEKAKASMKRDFFLPGVTD